MRSYTAIVIASLFCALALGQNDNDECNGIITDGACTPCPPGHTPDNNNVKCYAFDQWDQLPTGTPTFEICSYHDSECTELDKLQDAISFRIMTLPGYIAFGQGEEDAGCYRVKLLTEDMKAVSCSEATSPMRTLYNSASLEFGKCIKSDEDNAEYWSATCRTPSSSSGLSDAELGGLIGGLSAAAVAAFIGMCVCKRRKMYCFKESVRESGFNMGLL